MPFISVDPFARINRQIVVVRTPTRLLKGCFLTLLFMYELEMPESL